MHVCAPFVLIWLSWMVIIPRSSKCDSLRFNRNSYTRYAMTALVERTDKTPPICFIWWSNRSQLQGISLVCPSQGHTHHHGRLCSHPLAAFSNPAEVQRGPHKNTMVVRLYLLSLSFMERCSEEQRTEQSEIMRGAQASYSLKLHEDHPESKWRGFEPQGQYRVQVVLIHLIHFAATQGVQFNYGTC